VEVTDKIHVWASVGCIDFDVFKNKSVCYTVKKVIAFPARMSLTKLSLAGNNLIIPGQEEFG
jgi:hypothetical protein